MREKLEGMKKKYWPPRKDQLLVLVLFGLLLAVIAVPVEKKREVPQEPEEVSREETKEPGEDYERRIKKKLQELLETVEHLVTTGEQLRDGWQLGRATMVLGFGYIAGYLTRRNCWSFPSPPGRPSSGPSPAGRSFTRAT